MYYRTGCLVFALLLTSVCALAQTGANDGDHVTWHFSSLKQSPSEWKLVFTAVIDRGWHLYSQGTAADGPMPVSFRFQKDEAFRVVGKVKESGVLREGFDDVFMTDVSWYEGNVIFSQMVKVKAKGMVRGEISYAICSEEMCIPGGIQFSLEVGN